MLLRIKTEAAHFFHALLRITDDSLAAPAAPVLVRSLIECWAHAHWITEGVPGSSQPSTSAGRALCLELGMASSFVNNLKRASAEAQPDTALQAATEWLESVRDKHTKLGCNCRGRTYRDVQPTLKHIAKSAEMSWVYDTWLSASAAGHILMPQRLARQVGDHTEWGGEASVLERQNWLERGTVCTINTYLFVIGGLRRDRVPQYEEVIKPVMSDMRAVNKIVMAADAAQRAPTDSAGG
jgi:hypothetical protein